MSTSYRAILKLFHLWWIKSADKAKCSIQVVLCWPYVAVSIQLGDFEANKITEDRFYYNNTIVLKIIVKIIIFVGREHNFEQYSLNQIKYLLVQFLIP